MAFNNYLLHIINEERHHDISKKFTPEELQAIKDAFMQTANDIGPDIDLENLKAEDVAEVVLDNIERYYMHKGARMGKKRYFKSGKEFDKELYDKLVKAGSYEDLLKFGAAIWRRKI